MSKISQFRVLIAVAEAGGIRAAAEKINRTVSAISVTLKQLESELGGALFVGERKSKLTPFGEFVLHQARSLIEHSDRVERSITVFRESGEGSVDVAMLPSIASAFLPEAIRRFTERNSNAVLHVRDLDSHSILDAVVRESVEWGIASPSASPDFTTRPLFSEPLCIVCPLDHPLNDLVGPVPWHEVRKYTFFSNGSHYQLEDSPDFPAVVERQRIHVRSVLSLFSLVRAGVGITVLPSLLQAGWAPDVRFLPIADANARRTVAMLSRSDRNLSPAARQFAQTLLTSVAERAGDYGLRMLESSV